MILDPVFVHTLIRAFFLGFFSGSGGAPSSLSIRAFTCKTTNISDMAIIKAATAKPITIGLVCSIILFLPIFLPVSDFCSPRDPLLHQVLALPARRRVHDFLRGVASSWTISPLGARL